MKYTRRTRDEAGQKTMNTIYFIVVAVAVALPFALKLL